MAIANPTLGNVARDPTNFKPHPERFSIGSWGELIIGGGTDFTSASNPSSEVIDGTGVALGRDYRVTGAVAAGSLTTEEAGDFLVELELFDFSCASASGNVQFTLQYAPDGVTYAAFDATDAGGGGRLQVIRAALTSKESIMLRGVQHLNQAGKVRCIVTSAAGGVITITEGRLRLTKVSDNNPVTP